MIPPPSAWARRVPFRLAVAAACIAVQLALLVHSGTRFGAPFNAAPGQPPGFNDPAREQYPQRWNRLVVSRWDAGQYIELALRGYKYCPPRDPQGRLPASRTCNLSFYPTYGVLGRLASAATHIPLDYALWAISLLASFIFLFLWTGPALVDRIGLAQTYLSLLLFNVFTTGFSLVTVQTEPLTLALTMGAFVAVARRRWWLAALLAGAASGMRITGVAVGAACAVAIALDTWRERPRTRAQWARRAALVLLCGWGQIALMAVHAHRFGDPLAYLHAHARDFRHSPSLWTLIAPAPELIVRSIEKPQHEGVWLVGALLWFLIGGREALRPFPASERGFWYGLFFATVAISAVGMAPISFAGMTRYLLLALPLFFAIAHLCVRRPALLVLWIIVSAWSYWNVDLCYYTGGPGNRTLQICGANHWVGRI